MRLLLLVLAVVFALADESGVAAQSSAKPPQPDFSGHWTLQEPTTASPTIATELIVKQTITDTTVHGKPMTPFYNAIEIERRLGTESRFEKHSIGIIGGIVGGLGTDGRPLPDYRKTEFSTKWDGDRLVLKTETEESRDSVPAIHQETWSFDEKGRLVVVITDQSSGLEPRTRTLVYRRS